MLRPRQCSSERSGEQSTPFADRSDEREPENFYIRHIAWRPSTIWKRDLEMSLNDLKFKKAKKKALNMLNQSVSQKPLKLLYVYNCMQPRPRVEADSSSSIHFWPFA